MQLPPIVSPQERAATREELPAQERQTPVAGR